MSDESGGALLAGLATDATGTIVAWQRYDVENGGRTSGNFRAEAAVVPGGAVFSQPMAEHGGIPALAANASGTAVLAWPVRRPDGATEIHVSRRAPGGPFGTPVAVPGSAATSGLAPAVGLDDAGTATIAWTAGPATTAPPVAVTTQSADGSFAPVTPIASPGAANRLVFAEAGTGAAVLAWADDGPSFGRASASIRPSGGAFGPVETVGTTGARPLSATIAGDGRAVLTLLSGWDLDEVERPPGGPFGPLHPVESRTAAGDLRVAGNDAGARVLSWSAVGPHRPSWPAGQVTRLARQSPSGETVTFQELDPALVSDSPSVAVGPTGAALAVTPGTPPTAGMWGIRAMIAPAGARFGAAALVSKGCALADAALATVGPASGSVAWIGREARARTTVNVATYAPGLPAPAAGPPRFCGRVEPAALYAPFAHPDPYRPRLDYSLAAPARLRFTITRRHRRVGRPIAEDAPAAAGRVVFPRLHHGSYRLTAVAVGRDGQRRTVHATFRVPL